MNSIVGPLVRAVMEKLSDLLEQEFMLQKSLQSDIASLSAELRAMNSVLAELAGRGRQPDEQVKDFRNQLRELAYDVEDAIDRSVHRLHKPGDRSRLDKLVAKPWELREKRSLAKRVGKCKARAAELSRRWQRRRCKAEDAVIGHPLLPENPPPHEVLQDLMDPGGLVGMDGPRDEVVRLLTGGVPEAGQLLKVVSVVGLAGIGKTTLAKAIYSSIRSDFECSAFVSMSRSDVAAKDLKDVLCQIGEPTNGNSDELALINQIREFLRTKRYLIVIDDVWCTSSWEIIRAALPENNRGSRMLITTRIESLAQSCCSNWDDHVYRISTLSDRHSKELFHRRVFGSEDRCPPHLKQISAKIVKECGGVPLAVVTVAGLLVATPSSEENWETVLHKLSVCSEHEESPDAEPVKRALALSYCSLPDYLKPCLLYLGLFPRDDVIMRDRLIWLWIAEGFVSPGNRGSPAVLPKTGEAYFNELINRSMIKPVHINYRGEVRACRVHDMMLDLIRSVAAEESFIAPNIAGNTSAPKVKVRRISLANRGDNHTASFETTINLSSTRYISLFGSVKYKLQLKNLRLLRALELTECEDFGESDLINITELFQLKYLAIRHTRIRNLPAQIGRLHSLEILDVRDTCVRELPKSFSQMTKLLHLHVDRVRLPDKIGNVLELLSLGHFDILQSPLAAVQGLGYLLNLRELLIHWAPGLSCSDTDKYGKCLRYSLDKLLHLESLDIDGSCFNVDFLDYWSPSPDLQRFHVGGGCYLPRVAKWMALQANLTYLSVNLLEVSTKDLHLLGGIPTLRHLFMSSKQVHAEKLIIRSGQFPCLQGFLLHCPWVYLTFEHLAMPRLLNLFLPIHVVTAETNDFSFGIEHLESLRNVEVRINGEGADASKTKAAEVAVAKAAHNHPNHPILQITWHSTAGSEEGMGFDATLLG
ncbi:hypothetical protein C2845_PM05G17310 [Panicum miliaceum]|uniref:AAA+ ATPase domain-containing protein n=1 Tax=Panicum miliaceum TaxID=4540 RepID=A0A3L6SVP3_PANMI|nr:hypothetical protein C2845_PM05G17310 [Panicum miliaceum]